MAEWEQPYEEWRKASGYAKKEALARLVTVLQPYISKEANKWKGNLNPVILEAEALKQAIQGIKTYTPGMSALPTHVTNYVKKVSRLAYEQTSAGSIPEELSRQAGMFKKVQQQLEDKHGREATVSELMDELSWPKSRVELMLRKLQSGSSITESNVEFVHSPFHSNTDSNVLDVVYYDLPKRDKLIMEHAYGYGGKPVLTTNALAAKLSVSPGLISQRKLAIESQIKHHLGGA